MVHCFKHIEKCLWFGLHLLMSPTTKHYENNRAVPSLSCEGKSVPSLQYNNSLVNINGVFPPIVCLETAVNHVSGNTPSFHVQPPAFSQ